MDPQKNTRNADYQRKLKTRDELLEIIGARPRSKSVIMCHGSFDIVHPGHIRHLMYAREKANILVASLTSDAYISKANFRPYVPEQLRAMNLAALEVVDYVIIDHNPTPLENLKFLQPDYFAKGYEYSEDSSQVLNPKTMQEKEIVESYGGEMIFTPGDIVYSSSAFIELAPPKIAGDKLRLLMQSEDITFADLRSTLEKFQGKHVHVIGDTIVDSYTYGSVIGGMTKTPTFSVKFERQVDFVGGAAIVAKHLRRAGAQVKFTSVLGNDDLKKFVINDLEKEGIDCSSIVIDKTRPTTQKNAIIAGGYRLLKVDKLDNRTISDKIIQQFKNALENSQTEAFIFSDFRHGIFSKRTIPEFISALPEGPLRIADSQVASRWGNILEFQNFDLITPNEREARFALGDQDSVVRPLAFDLYNKANCKYLLLKLGEKGSITYRPSNKEDPRAFFTLDSFAEKVVDAVGAGDALLAYATLSLIATKNIVISSILGSLGAAVACERDGNVPISPEEMTHLIDVTEKRITYS